MLPPLEITHSSRRRQHTLPKRPVNYQQAVRRHIPENDIPLGKLPQEFEQGWNIQSVFTV